MRVERLFVDISRMISLSSGQSQATQTSTFQRLTASIHSLKMQCELRICGEPEPID